MKIWPIPGGGWLVVLRDLEFCYVFVPLCSSVHVRCWVLAYAGARACCVIPGLQKKKNMWGINVLSVPWDSPLGHIESL